MEEQPLIDNRAPFELEKVGRRSALFYSVSGHPELFARFCYPGFLYQFEFKKAVKEIQEDDPSCSEKDAKTKAEKMIVEHLLKNASEFQDIMEQYHFSVVPFNYVIGKEPDSGEVGLFAVADRIQGDILPRVPFNEKIIKEVDQIYISVLEQTKNAVFKKGNYWGDFNNAQIMYGTKYGEEEPRAYITDLDPVVTKCPDPTKTFSEADMFWNLICSCFYDIRNAEESDQKPIFVETRKLLKDYLDKFAAPTDHMVVVRYEKMKEYLENTLE